MLEEHLAEAERHVGRRAASAEERQIIAEPSRDGHDVALALNLLEEMETTQRLSLADRERLRKELAADEAQH